MSRTRSEQAWALVMDSKSVADITRDAQADADQFLEEEKRLRARADAELRAVTPAGEPVEPNVWAWWNERPRDHIRDFTQETARKHGAGPSVVLHRLPAFWRYHAYKIARIVLMHARREGGGLKNTDAADAHHYAAAAYADVCVSDDEPLRRTAEAIPGLRRPITLVLEFLDLLALVDDGLDDVVAQRAPALETLHGGHGLKSKRKLVQHQSRTHPMTKMSSCGDAGA